MLEKRFDFMQIILLPSEITLILHLCNGVEEGIMSAHSVNSLLMALRIQCVLEVQTLGKWDTSSKRTFLAEMG